MKLFALAENFLNDQLNLDSFAIFRLVLLNLCSDESDTFCCIVKVRPLWAEFTCNPMICNFNTKLRLKAY